MHTQKLHQNTLFQLDCKIWQIPPLDVQLDQELMMCWYHNKSTPTCYSEGLKVKLLRAENVEKNCLHFFAVFLRITSVLWQNWCGSKILHLIPPPPSPLLQLYLSHVAEQQVSMAFWRRTAKVKVIYSTVKYRIIYFHRFENKSRTWIIYHSSHYWVYSW